MVYSQCIPYLPWIQHIFSQAASLVPHPDECSWRTPPSHGHRRGWNSNAWGNGPTEVIASVDCGASSLMLVYKPMNKFDMIRID